MKLYEIKQEGAALRLFVYLTLIVALLLPVSATTAQAAPVQQDAPAAPVSAAAVGTTYNVTSTNCTGPGSIIEAINQANANSGTDTIQLTPGLQIDATTCTFIDEIRPENYVIAAVTDSLIIEGNGGALNGNMSWVDVSGIVNNLSRCPYKSSIVTILGTMPGFLRIGDAFKDNPGLQVTIRDLRLQKFRQVAQVHKDASLLMEGVDMIDIWAWRWCNTPAIEAYDLVDITLQQSTMENYVSFQDFIGGKESFTGAIAGGGGGWRR